MPSVFPQHLPVPANIVLEAPAAEQGAERPESQHLCAAQFFAGRSGVDPSHGLYPWRCFQGWIQRQKVLQLGELCTAFHTTRAGCDRGRGQLPLDAFSVKKLAAISRISCSPC